MSDFAWHERHALADLFLTLGPHAPTIDEGWAACDLAAHLVIRERRPDAILGTYLPPLAGWQRSVAAGLIGQGWPRLVEQVRTPPRWSPVSLGPVHEIVNRQEFTIHHEDLRRAQPGWEPRTLEPGLPEALWSGLRRTARLLYRRSPVGVRLRTPAGDEVEAASGAPVVTLVGEPLELLLHATGRVAYARVRAVGDPGAVSAVVASIRGI